MSEGPSAVNDPVLQYPPLSNCRALVVEDDRWVRSSIDIALRHAGLQVVAVESFELAMEALEACPFDVIVLDVMLPGLDGRQGCRQLRKNGNHTPILMLSALVEVDDRVAGLEAGADGYMRKPFTIDELTIRVTSLLRRAQTPTDARLTVADLLLDTAARTCVRNDEVIELTKLEFDFVWVLARADGAVVDRDDLRRRVWHDTVSADSRSIDVCASNVRRKLGEPTLLQTVRGQGFALREAIS